MRNSRRMLAALVLATAALSGCAATSLVYQRLDILAGWRLDDYVTLDAAQDAVFRREFRTAWDWHRDSELPAYARDLREIDALLRSGAPATPAHIAGFVDRSEKHIERAVAQLLPPGCALARSFSDEQVAEVLDEVDERAQKFAREYAEPPERSLRAAAKKKTRKWISKWTGPLNPAQEALLAGWAAARHSLGPQWVEYRKRWREDFAAALAQRDAPQFCAQLEKLFLRPQAYQDAALAADFARNTVLWSQLIAGVINAADPAQRERARRQLRDMAKTFEELAAG